MGFITQPPSQKNGAVVLVGSPASIAFSCFSRSYIPLYPLLFLYVIYERHDFIGHVDYFFKLNSLPLLLRRKKEFEFVVTTPELSYPRYSNCFNPLINFSKTSVLETIPIIPHNDLTRKL